MLIAAHAPAVFKDFGNVAHAVVAILRGVTEYAARRKPDGRGQRGRMVAKLDVRKNSAPVSKCGEKQFLCF